MTPRSAGRACPVCTDPSSRVLHSQEIVAPDEFGLAPAFDVVECTNCGMVFADSAFDQDALDALYRDHSKYADISTFAPPASPPEAPWDLARLEGTAGFLAEHLDDRDARILDAGCATGALLGFLGALGFQRASGLDPSPLATATARERYDADAITGSFFTPPADLGTFDVVTLCHVLEHLADVQPAITALRELLEPGGLVYIEVPDASRYVDYLVAPFHDFNTEHINHFSLPMLDRLLVSAGFEAVTLERSTVLCSPTDEYPVALGLWRRTDDAAPSSFDPDPQLARGIREYIERSGHLMRRIDDGLRSRLAPGAPVMVWGAGQLTMKLLRDTVLREADVGAIIDSSPQKIGLHFAAIDVVSPEAAATMPGPVIVGSILHAADITVAASTRLGPHRDLISLRELAGV